MVGISWSEFTPGQIGKVVWRPTFIAPDEGGKLELGCWGLNFPEPYEDPDDLVWARIFLKNSTRLPFLSYGLTKNQGGSPVVLLAP